MTAELVIAGARTRMVREDLSAVYAAMWGVPERATVVSHWRDKTRERAYAMDPLFLTVLHTVDQRYVMAVWCVDGPLRHEMHVHSLPQGLAAEVFCVGTMDVPDNDAAVLMCREFARLIAHGDMPWPPESDADFDAWRLAGTLISTQPAR